MVKLRLIGEVVLLHLLARRLDGADIVHDGTQEERTLTLGAYLPDDPGTDIMFCHIFCDFLAHTWLCLRFPGDKAVMGRKFKNYFPEILIYTRWTSVASWR